MGSNAMSEIALTLRYKRTHPERRKTDVVDPFWALFRRNRRPSHGNMQEPICLPHAGAGTGLARLMVAKTLG
jgi:hypothetical protein